MTVREWQLTGTVLLRLLGDLRLMCFGFARTLRRRGESENHLLNQGHLASIFRPLFGGRMDH